MDKDKDKDREPGIRMIEGWFLLLGSMLLVTSPLLALLDPEALIGLLIAGVFFALLGLTYLIDRKTRKYGESHWVQAVPERLRISHGIWYCFVSAGPFLLAGLVSELFSGGLSKRLLAAGLILLLVLVFAAFVAIDRALVMRRKRREARGELPPKKMRLIHVIQAFFVVFMIGGLIVAALGDDPDQPAAGLAVAGACFLSYLVCLLVEKIVPQRGKFDHKSWVQGVYGYLIPFGAMSLFLGAYRLIDESAKTVPQNARIASRSHAGMAFAMAGLCFAAVAVTFVIQRLRRRGKPLE